jgi:hypothetical protein
MKKYVLALALCTGLSALAQDATRFLTPSPLGIVLSVHKFLTSDQKKFYQIQVQSSGKTFEQARQNAFRLAVEEVAGFAILSETELQNQNITRDEIITYSSAFVDKYKIVNQTESNNSVKLVVDVWVAESAIANRLLAKNATQGAVNGAQLGTQVDTLLDERSRGDSLLGAVLRDYPKRALTAKLGTPKIYMDSNRSTVIAIPWQVQWADEYIVSLNETLKTIAIAPKFWCLENCANVVSSVNGYAFDDFRKYDMVQSRVLGSDATLKIELKNIHGQTVFTHCRPIGIKNSSLFGMNGQNISIVPGRYLYNQEVLTFGQNTPLISTLDKIHAEVVERSQCRA